MSISVYFHIQKKVFTKWINTIIQRTNVPAIKDLQEGLSDGVILCKLLEVLSGKAAPRKYTPNIKSRHHKIQNLSIAMGFLSLENVKVTGCVAEDFADGNLNKVLTVIWQIILKYQIQTLGLHSDNPKVSIKECLLTWVRGQVKEHNIEMKDFLQCWVDGFAFSVLAFKFTSRILDPSNFTKENALDNLKFAFAAGQEHFGIVPLLEPEDMLNKYIDELSVMTYVSFYPKAYERAAKAHEILILKRSTSKLGNLDLEVLTTSPHMGSPRRSVSSLSPVLSSPRLSSLLSSPNKIPPISLVSLQAPQPAQLKRQTPPPSFLTSQPIPAHATSPSDAITPASPATVPPSALNPPLPTPSTSNRGRSSTTSSTPSHEHRISPSRSCHEGGSSTSPSPSPSPFPSRSSHHPSNSPHTPPAHNPHRRSSLAIPKEDDAPPHNPATMPEKAKFVSFSGFDNSQIPKRNASNRHATSILAKEVMDVVRGARGEEKDSSGPSVIMREAKDLVKEINLRIEEARKDKEAEDKEEEEKAQAEENSMASRATVSTSEHEGPPRGSNLTMSWTEGEETSSDSNNGSPVVGKRGNSIGHAHGLRVGNNLVGSNALEEEIATLKKRLALVDHRNEENLILLDDARSKLERAANCVHTLLRKTQGSPGAAGATKLETEELHEWQIKREQKLKHLQQAQDESSTLKVAMDMVHEELLYTEHANELLQQKIIDTEMQLEDSKRALENANTEKSKDLDVLKYEWKLANSEKEKLIYLLEKEQYEHKKLQGFYDQAQKAIEDLQKQLAEKGPHKEIPRLNFDAVKRANDQPHASPASLPLQSPSIVRPSLLSPLTSPRLKNTSPATNEAKSLPHRLQSPTLSPSAPLPTFSPPSHISQSSKSSITSPRDRQAATLRENLLMKKKSDIQMAREQKLKNNNNNNNNNNNSNSNNNNNQKNNKLKTQLGTIDLNDLDEFITEFSKPSSREEEEYKWEMMRKDSGNLDIHLNNLINGNSRSYRTKKIEDGEDSDVAYSSDSNFSPSCSLSPTSESDPFSFSPNTSSAINLFGIRSGITTTGVDKSSNRSDLGDSGSLISSPKIAPAAFGEKSSKPDVEGVAPSRTSVIGEPTSGYAPRRNTIGDASENPGEVPVLTRRRSNSLFSSSSDDASGAEPSSPENINQIVQLQYDEMNTRLAYLREQIGNLAAKHYGPNAHRKLQSKQSMKRRKPQHFSSLEHVHVESTWKKHTKSFSQLSCVCLIFNQIGQVVSCQNSVSKVQQQLGSGGNMSKSKSLMRISPAMRQEGGANGSKASETGYLESGIRFHTTPTQPIASTQGSFTLDLTIQNIPDNGTSVLVLITPEDSDSFANFSQISTKVSTIGKPKTDGSTYTEKNWGVWNKLIPEPANSSCESLAVVLLSREDVSAKSGRWRLDFLCSEISELNTHELPLDFLQNSMVVKNYLPTKFQLEKCMEELSALERMKENWNFLSQDNGEEEDEEDTSKDRYDVDETEHPLEPKDREVIEARLDEMLREYNIPSTQRWASGDVFRIGNQPVSLFLQNNILYARTEDQPVQFEEWLSKFVKKIVRIEVVRSGTFGL